MKPTPASGPLWVELCCEPLPVDGMATWMSAWTQAIQSELKAAGYFTEAPQSFGSAYRLTWLFPDCRPEPSLTLKQIRGPSERFARDSSGEWSQAAWAWARKHHTSPEAAEWRLSPPKQERFLWLTQQAEPLDLMQRWGELWRSALQKVELPVQLHWEQNGEACCFLRPIRRVAAQWGSTPLQGSLFGLPVSQGAAAALSPGKAIASLPVASCLEYREQLQSQSIWIEPLARKKHIEAALKSKAASVGGEWIADEALLEHVSGTLETPYVALGTFPSADLKLPLPAIQKSLKQEMFAFCIKGKDGVLLPYFLVVIQKPPTPSILRGYEFVVRSRLRDVQFFYEQDLQSSWERWQTELSRLMVHPRLGHMGLKMSRLKSMALKLGDVLELNHIAALSRALALCKLDICSQLVQEMPDLAGAMGAHYAQKWGEPEAVANILSESYQPQTSSAALPSSDEACLLSLVDKIDDVMGMVGVNLMPSGAKDPFGVRRAALGVLRILIERGWDLDLRLLLQWSYVTYPGGALPIEAIQQAFNYLKQRLRAWWEHQGHATFLLDSAMESETFPLRMHQKLHALEHLVQHAPELWQRLRFGFKRLLGFIKRQPIRPAFDWKELEAQSFHPCFTQILSHIQDLGKQHQSSTPSQASFLQHWERVAELLPAWEQLFDEVHFESQASQQLELWTALFKKLQWAWSLGGGLESLAYHASRDEATY